MAFQWNTQPPTPWKLPFVALEKLFWQCSSDTCVLEHKQAIWGGRSCHHTFFAGSFGKRDDFCSASARKFSDECFHLIRHSRGWLFSDDLEIFFLEFRILILTFPRI